MFTVMCKDSNQYLDARRLNSLGFKFAGRRVQQKTYIQNKYRLDIEGTHSYLWLTADYQSDIPVIYSAMLVQQNYALIKRTKITTVKTLDQLLDDIIYVASN